jgi:L-ascorbate metabolism protein UlaG (beta-lactamase superfamily)
MMSIDTILQSDNGLGACWLGNAGWLFAQGGHLIATDLDFFLPERILPAFAELPKLAERLDYLLITHAHTDHFNPETVRALIEQGPCTVLLPESCRGCAAEYGLDPSRILYAKPGCTPLDPYNNPLPLPRTGWEVSGLPQWLGIEAIRALHGAVGGAVYTGANSGDCGYLIRFGGMLIAEPGDSVLLEEHLTLANIDLLLVSPTEHNMGVEKARFLIETVRPKRIFAQHFGTYRETAENAFWTHGFQQELFDALSPEMQGRFTIPVYAEPYLLS